MVDRQSAFSENCSMDQDISRKKKRELQDRAIFLLQDITFYLDPSAIYLLVNFG